MPDADDASRSKLGRTLHRELVGMLFALVIAQVAVRTAQLSTHECQYEHLAAYAHLFLAAIVVTASWVGWGKSQSSLSNIKDIFSIDAVELGMDLLLVVLYFLLIQSVEFVDGDSSKNPKIIPNATNEGFWLFVIFIVYLLWDVITKVSLRKMRRRANWTVTRFYSSRFVQRSWGTVICCILIGVLYFVLLPEKIKSTHQLLMADATLLFLVLLYRAMKLRDLARFNRRAIGWMVGLGFLGMASLVCTLKCSL